MGDKNLGTRAALAVAVACGLLFLGTPAAGAADQDPDPLAPLTGTVDKVLTPVKDATGTTPAPRANGTLPFEDNDDPDRETTDPSGPDHGSGESVDADAGDQDVADIAGSDATVEDAEASSGHSEARSGVAAVCVGGTDGDATDCDGQVGAGAVQSKGEVDRNADGRTTASSGSSAANACLQQDPLVGTCTVDADVVRSEGRSDSAGSASKDS